MIVALKIRGSFNRSGCPYTILHPEQNPRLEDQCTRQNAHRDGKQLHAQPVHLVIVRHLRLKENVGKLILYDVLSIIIINYLYLSVYIYPYIIYHWLHHICILISCCHWTRHHGFRQFHPRHLPLDTPPAHWSWTSGHSARPVLRSAAIAGRFWFNILSLLFVSGKLKHRFLFSIWVSKQTGGSEQPHGFLMKQGTLRWENGKTDFFPERPSQCRRGRGRCGKKWERQRLVPYMLAKWTEYLGPRCSVMIEN